MPDTLTSPQALRATPQALPQATPQAFRATKKEILNPINLGRLCTLGYQKMQNSRKVRMKMLQAFTGRLYGRRSSGRGEDYGLPTPINMINQATMTLVPNLVFKDPRAAITAEFLSYRPYAEVSELALDHLVQEINLRMTLRKIITDSILLAGFVKTSIAISGYTLDIEGNLHDVGQPYADRVDPDDILIDPVARDWDEQRFTGNRFRIDITDDIMDSGMYDPDDLRMLSSRYQGFNTSDQASSLSGGVTYSEADQIINTVDLVEVWIPSENVIVTLPWQPGYEIAPKILRTADYQGPERGPYAMLGYAFVPDNIMPVAPAMMWYDLHQLTNQIARKAGNQAERQKSVLAYESSAFQDAQEIADADDGLAVRVDNIDAIKEISYGGASDDNFKYIDWAKQQFSEMAMNIDLLSGAGSDEATATQAEMVQANVSIRLSDMQGLVYQFTGDIMRSLFFYLHTDPLIELPLVKRVSGQDEQVVYSPEMREGDWQDYNIKIRPYSMSRQNPNTKVRRLLEFFGNIIPALANAAQMLGPALNLEAAINIVGRELGIEELDEIINSQVLRQINQQMQSLIEQGIPTDPKVAKIMQIMSAGQGAGQGVGGGPMPGAPAMNAMQPNPMAQMQTGMTGATEQNQMAQETAGELQSAMR